MGRQRFDIDAEIAASVERIVAAAPPPTPEQRARLRTLLAPAAMPATPVVVRSQPAGEAMQRPEVAA